MDPKRCLGSVLALLLTVTSSLRAADEPAVVKEAACLLEQIATDPESGIPAQHLREASGILIIPHVGDTRLGIGRKRGRGMFLTRDNHGEWGHPEAVEISGVSAKAEASRQITDIVM